jgi:hypothetical protein
MVEIIFQTKIRIFLSQSSFTSRYNSQKQGNFSNIQRISFKFLEVRVSVLFTSTLCQGLTCSSFFSVKTVTHVAGRSSAPWSQNRNQGKSQTSLSYFPSCLTFQGRGWLLGLQWVPTSPVSLQCTCTLVQDNIKALMM